MNPLLLQALRQPKDQIEPRSFRLSKRTLVALKCLLIASVAAAALARPGARIAADPDLGIELRVPRDWHGRPWAPFGVEACELRSDAERLEGRLPPQPTQGCRVSLERFAWSDFELARRLLTGRVPPTGWRDHDLSALREVACYLGMQETAGTAERRRLAGRPALMTVAPRHDGVGAVIVAPAADLVFLHIYAPTELELRRVWPAWIAMVNSVRVRGSVEPVLWRLVEASAGVCSTDDSLP